MNEAPLLPNPEIRLRRSLLQLQRVTAAELSSHSGVDRTAVEQFLHTNPQLVERVNSKEPHNPLLAGRAKAPTWRLLSAAAVCADLRRLVPLDAACQAELAKSGRDLEQRVLELVAAVRDLRQQRAELNPEIFDAERRRLALRAGVMRIALKDLTAIGLTDTGILLQQAIKDLETTIAINPMVERARTQPLASERLCLWPPPVVMDGPAAKDEVNLGGGILGRLFRR